MLYLRSLPFVEHQQMLRNRKVFAAFQLCSRFPLHCMQTVNRLPCYLSKKKKQQIVKVVGSLLNPSCALKRG